MPESGVTKHNYLFCQFVNPARGHEGDRCDCFDTPTHRRTTLAKQRLARLRANREINRASTSNDPESAVASDPAVTRSDNRPFGGVPIVFGGDFQQMLPVIVRGSRADIVDATIQCSEIWNNIRIFNLQENMHLERD